MKRTLAALVLALCLPGMTVGAAEASVPAPRDAGESRADREAIQHTLDTIYAAISGPAGQPRDWDRFRGAFTEDARLFAITPEGLRGGSVEDYVAMSGASLVAFGFSEAELANRIEIYGNLAQVWSSYEGSFIREGQKAMVRGINSFQLRRMSDGSWRVHSLLWQQETPQFPLPDEMAAR